jgi:hypothetical protein
MRHPSSGCRFFVAQWLSELTFLHLVSGSRSRGTNPRSTPQADAAVVVVWGPSGLFHVGVPDNDVALRLAPVRGRDDRPQVLRQLDGGLAVVVLVADVRVLAGRGEAQVHVGVGTERDRQVLEELVELYLPLGRFGGPLVVVAGNEVDGVEPLAVGFEDAAREVDHHVEGMLAARHEADRVCAEADLVARDGVTGKDNVLDAVAHPHQQGRAHHPGVITLPGPSPSGRHGRAFTVSRPHLPMFNEPIQWSSWPGPSPMTGTESGRQGDSVHRDGGGPGRSR